jgi:dienelactone hydrolase
MIDTNSTRSRRSLLRAGALGGGAAAVLAAFRAGAAGGTTPADRAALAAATSPAVVNQINAAGASYQTYYDAFRALATRIEALADRELAARHTASARGAYLRAASYYDMCLYFILGTAARAGEAGAYAAMQNCWQQASQLFAPPFEPVRIPYGDSWMPGYLLRPDDRRVRRPTIILNNGQDAQHVALYAMGGAAALERGYNALLFYGPGQGSMLFERQVPFRYDWENVITPVVDYLRSRPDVDPARIALGGSSLGGELVIRAAAFEHRLAAVVADPGFLSVWLTWSAKFPPIAALFASGASKQEINAVWQDEIVPRLDAVDRYEVAKTSEGYGSQFLQAARAGQVFTDMYDFGTTVQRFTVAGVTDRVTAPTLVTSYQDDELVIPPAKQGPEVFKLLRGDKQYHYFTAAQGAQFHCAPMAPQVRNQVVYDWLEGIL